jgi:predicted nucleotidyltransferase
MSEQNIHVKWRLDFATELAERIHTFVGVQAIVVGGSVARGYADEYSDLELAIFWDTQPNDDTRQDLVAALNAEFLYGYDGPSKEDQLLINGFQVDLWQNTVKEEEAVISAVLQDCSTDLGHSNFMDTIRSCIPLYGDAIIQGWKQRAEQYPDELALRNVREHIAGFEAGQLAVLAHRDNPCVFYGHISHLQQEAFLVLLALNGWYFPAYKWMYRSLDSMPVKPQRVAERFRRVFKVSYAEAIADTIQVLDETLDLVEQRFPQIDTIGVRRRLTITRTAHRPSGRWYADKVL